MSLSDSAWGRTRTRLEGLTDEEYLWEPAAGCWSLRLRADGSWRLDDVRPQPDPAPLSTIAWRIAHLVQCYGQRRNAVMLGVDDDQPDIEWRVRASGRAAEALDALEAAHARWQEVMARVDDDWLSEPIGPVGGPYASDSRAAFALHMVDEFVHHGAEVALLRDLHRALHDPPVPPASVREAAARGDWRRVTELVAAGTPVEHDGITALHYAAGAGEAAVADLLVAHGADLTAVDPQFDATPSGWAAYFGHAELAAALDAAPPG